MWWLRRADPDPAELQRLADSLLTEWDPNAVRALRAARDSGVVALIAASRRTRGRDESERLNEALVRMGRRAVPRLIESLGDPRVGAAWALGVMGDRRVVEPLIAATTA